MSGTSPPAFLPAPVRWVLNWLLFSLFVEGEQLKHRMRKCFVAGSFSFTPLLVAFIVAYSIKAARSPEVLYGHWLTISVAITLVPLAVANFVYVKVTRCMSDFHVGVAFLLSAILWSATYFGYPAVDPRMVTAAIALSAILTQPPQQPLILGWSFVLAGITVYNDVYRTAGTVLLLVPGEIRPGSPWEAMIAYLLGSLTMVFLLVGVAVQTAAHISVLNAARDSVEMSNDVVELLSEYDTEGVAQRLNCYEARGTISGNLIHSYREMNRNLEIYRPHLPNYVLMRGDDTPEQEGDSRKTSRSTTSEPDAVRAALASPRSEATEATNPEHDPGRPVRRSSNAACMLGIYLGDSVFMGRVSMTRLDLQPLMAREGAKLATPEAMSQFLEAVYRLAKTYLAAMHSAVGDEIVLSWNATRRVIQHEAKAARFLLRLSHVAAEITGASLAGVVFTGPGRCDCVTSDSTRQQAVLIHATWLDAMDEAFALAQRSGACIIDGETNLLASYDLATQCVDRIHFVPRDAPDYRFGRANASLLLEATPQGQGIALGGSAKGKLLFEVVGELGRKDEEWMYQLEERGDETRHALVTRAFDLAVDRRFSEAAALLGRVVLGESPSVAPTRDGAELNASSSCRLSKSGEMSALVRRLVEYCSRLAALDKSPVDPAV